MLRALILVAISISSVHVFAKEQLSAASTDVGAINIKVFKPYHYNEIIHNHKNRNLFLLFWSVDCSPCLKEMRMIANLSAQERENFVFVSVDGHENITEVRNVISKTNLINSNHWIFDSEQTEQIISSVNNGWYGETPRLEKFINLE